MSHLGCAQLFISNPVSTERWNLVFRGIHDVPVVLNMVECGGETRAFTKGPPVSLVGYTTYHVGTGNQALPTPHLQVP